MQTFFMLVRTVDNVILSVSTADVWKNVQAGEVVRSGPFDTGVTYKGYPLEGGTFTDGGVYTAPQKPCIKGTWSGPGSGVDPRVMTAGSGNVATLTLQKRDDNTDQDINSGTEEFWLCIQGAAKPSKGKIVLDSNGQDVVTFTPDITDKGMSVVSLIQFVGDEVVPLSFRLALE